MIKILFFIFLSGFILLIPQNMQSRGLMYHGDDFDYFAHASSMVFGKFPSYKLEYFGESKKSPLGMIGASILAAPFVYIFSTIDRLEGSDIVLQRTQENVPPSWSVFGFIFASVFYFSTACFLLYFSIKLYVRAPIAAWAVIAMVICQGLPLFAFRRPVFSHVFEFFLQSLFVYLFLKNEFLEGRFIKKWWSFILVGLVSVLMILTRFNNIIFAITWPLFFIGRISGEGNLKIRLRQLFFILIPVLLFIGYFVLWPQFYNQHNPYANPPTSLLLNKPFDWVLKRIIRIFIGLDWGLVFTAPFLLLSIIGFVRWKHPLRKKYVLAILPLCISFLSIIYFGSQGSWYGYRYLIASAFPLMVLPLALFFNIIGKRLRVIMFLIALLPLMAMINFESNPSTNLSLIMEDCDRLEYGNANYMIDVWQNTLHIKQTWRDIFIGGPLYFYNLIQSFFIWASYGKTGFKFFYYFEFKTLIKFTLILLTPFCVGWFFHWLDMRQKKIYS